MGHWQRGIYSMQLRLLAPGHMLTLRLQYAEKTSSTCPYAHI